MRYGLLQIATGITKCDDYYKLRQYKVKQRYCFYHTDLGQNAIFHNFATQIALIQYSGRKNFQNHIRLAGSQFCSANCSECLKEHTRVKLQHNEEIIMFIQFY